MLLIQLNKIIINYYFNNQSFYVNKNIHELIIYVSDSL